MSRRADIWDKGIATGALVIVTGFYAFVIYAIPMYQELFRDFETSLPISTRIVFGTYLYWSIFFVALGVGGCTLILLRGDRRGWYFLAPALLSIFVLLPVTIWAMYAPPFVLDGAT